MRDALLSFWNEPRVAGAPRRVWRDWVLVALLVPACVVEVLLRPDVPYRWAAAAVALGGIPLLLIRRTRPLLAVATIFGGALALELPWLIDGAEGPAPGLWSMAYALLLGYALFRWGSGRDAAIGLAIMLAAATIAAVFDFSGLSEAIGGYMVFLLVLASAVAVRYRARERATARDEVRAREREELARDLHDTVAHHVSAIAIRAQAGLATADADPGAAVEALRVIDAEATRTLSEMRAIVRGLRRDDAATFAPLPGIADVPELARGPSGGPEVHVALEGDPAAVPAPVAAAAYRLVQEAVTNARRHARRASRIDVLVRTGDDAVRVEVVDDGEGASRGRQGFGIVGMIERAERLGGTCTAGPRRDRGWAVIAELPLRGASA